MDNRNELKLSEINKRESDPGNLILNDNSWWFISNWNVKKWSSQFLHQKNFHIIELFASNTITTVILGIMVVIFFCFRRHFYSIANFQESFVVCCCWELAFTCQNSLLLKKIGKDGYLRAFGTSLILMFVRIHFPLFPFLLWSWAIIE